MTIENLTAIINQANLILSFILIFQYGFTLGRISRSRVDGKFKKAQIALVILFIGMLIKGGLQAGIYTIVLGDPTHIVQALYLENLKNLIVNLLFMTTGFLFIWTAREE